MACKGKITSKISNLRRSHKDSEKLDLGIQWNMCKHVHLVQRYRKEHPESVPKSEEICSDNDSDEDCDRGDITSTIVHCVSKKVEDTSRLEHAKQLLINKLTVAVQNISSAEEFRQASVLCEEELLKHLNSIHSALSTSSAPTTSSAPSTSSALSTSSAPATSSAPSTSSTPSMSSALSTSFAPSTSSFISTHNKKINPQRRLFSTKKYKNKQKRRQKILIFCLFKCYAIQINLV
ncbi:PREDICTED: protein PRY2-like isoform X2 [Nicrophorus vespilloides]|uniref:Protein PRY2-like isoform X2 n=1 Tax=Nicrophorus vespilloides TaxID=110193 RepID=A0ABM1N351_NICVS|nr:PREDICTED: protein PRY2-like isoform X2 [Nicrophorus vespilloides]